jgi:hypothetical protein
MAARRELGSSRKRGQILEHKTGPARPPPCSAPLAVYPEQNPPPIAQLSDLLRARRAARARPALAQSGVENEDLMSEWKQSGLGWGGGKRARRWQCVEHCSLVRGMPRILVCGDVADGDQLEMLEEKVGRLDSAKGPFDALFVVGDLCTRNCAIFGTCLHVPDGLLVGGWRFCSAGLHGGEREWRKTAYPACRGTARYWKAFSHPVVLCCATHT